MKKNEIINFKIESLDSLCQGVYKDSTNEQIYFIPKVLPGEEGQAFINASKKNVNFATMTKLLTESDKRVSPTCPHFSSCGGCQLLHVAYEDELQIKKDSVIDIFKRQHKIDVSNILECINAPRRDSYRNRIQLQYDMKQKIIGFLSDDNKEIIKVDQCKVALPEIFQEIEQIYKDEKWLNSATKMRGHLEIYKKDGEILKTWDSRYSHEGFSQVFDEMNQVLLDLVVKESSHIKADNYTTIDLFGGAGNLSKHLQTKTIVIDSTPSKYIKLASKNQIYKEIDIYSEGALDKLSTALSAIKNDRFLIVDPPRSGLKNLNEFCDIITPKSIIYVSCNPQTLARDLKNVLDKYSLKKLIQLDFFPGTRHYETVAILELN